MFDRMQYVIERKQSVTSVFLSGFAGVTFEVKDADRNLLGHFKKQERLGEGEFWIEGTDGTRLGEIRTPEMGYTIYDAQSKLQATIKGVPAKKEESRRGLLAIILAVMPVAAIPAALLLSLAVPGFSQMLETPVLASGLVYHVSEWFYQEIQMGTSALWLGARAHLLVRCFVWCPLLCVCSDNCCNTMGWALVKARNPCLRAANDFLGVCRFLTICRSYSRSPEKPRFPAEYCSEPN